jgi:hypothetical protein
MKSITDTFVLLSKNIKIRIYKTITLPVVLYGCETFLENSLLEDREGDREMVLIWILERQIVTRKNECK